MYIGTTGQYQLKLASITLDSLKAFQATNAHLCTVTPVSVCLVLSCATPHLLTSAHMCNTSAAHI